MCLDVQLFILVTKICNEINFENVRRIYRGSVYRGEGGEKRNQVQIRISTIQNWEGVILIQMVVNLEARVARPTIFLEVFIGWSLGLFNYIVEVIWLTFSKLRALGQWKQSTDLLKSSIEWSLCPWRYNISMLFLQIVLEEMFIRIVALKNVAIFMEFLFNFIRMRLQHRCFPLNIAKFLKAVLVEHLW